MTSTSPPTSFESFPRLPVELRLKIWSFAQSSYPSQTFTLRSVRRSKPHKHGITTIRATASQPALTQVSQEARLIALEHFSQTTATEISNSRSAKEYPPDHKCALVNFSIDVFAIEMTNSLPYDPSASLRRIQLLRARVKDFLFFCSDLRGSSLNRFEDLREVEYIVWNGPHLTEDLEESVERMIFAMDFVREEKPSWNFPRVRIVEDGGAVLKVCEGGPWIRRV